MRELQQKKREDNGELIASEVAELERLASRNGGVLETAKVLEAARKQSSPLHKHFTWDDTRAAHEYRLSQARSLIRSYQVTVVQRDDGPTIRAPMFVNVKSVDDDGERAQFYVRTVDALKDPVRRKLVLDRAMAEATAWADRYQHLEELGRIVSTIRG